MLFATAGQGALFLWMMTSGVAIGLWYTLLAALRHFIQAGFWLTLLCDLLLGVGAAAIWIFFLVSGNYGRVRLFEALSALLGTLIFALAASPALQHAQNALQRALHKIKGAVARNHLIKVIFK